VHIVNALVGADAIEHAAAVTVTVAAAPPHVERVPANVRHRQPEVRGEARHAAGDHAQALDAAGLFRSLKQQLQAEADPQERLPGLDVVRQGVD
jgi:hypothetical protein